MRRNDITGDDQIAVALCQYTYLKSIAQSSISLAQVEEIGETGMADSKVPEGLLKRAYKAESKKGLTEVQRKTMKKVSATLLIVFRNHRQWVRVRTAYL